MECTPRPVIMLGGKSYVKLARSKGGFARLVFHDCKTLPKPVPENMSLTSSLDYESLETQRNAKQAEELTVQEVNETPVIFKDVVKETGKPKPKKRSRAQTTQRRKAPGSHCG